MLESTRYVLLALLIVASAGGGQPQPQAGADLLINEIMASNSSSVKDPQGQYDDWIEICNRGDHAVDIGGMYLTDDYAIPTKWRIPSNDAAATTIDAGKFLLIWADGDTTDPGLHATFELDSDGEELALFDRDGITPIDNMTFPAQVNNVAYGRSPDTDGWSFMRSPTPGQANTTGAYDGVVAQVEFSHSRGFRTSPFDVTLTCPTPGATICYTLDGSDPSFGTAYSGAIRVTKTTCLRARALKPQWLPANGVTHTYLFITDVIHQPRNPPGFPISYGSWADYEMDPDITNSPIYAPLMEEALLSLPSLSVVMNTNDLFGSNGIYANPTGRGANWERPTSIEMIYPDGRPGFQINCGIQIQGGAFRTMSAKHSLRLVFKGLYGAAKLRYPLFGADAVDEFDTVTLRAGANDGYSWRDARYTEQYIRDEFGRGLQQATGNVGPHGIFVHLYLNGLYWGLYNPVERPDASFSASYYGGRKEDWDSIHKGGDALEAVDGDLNAWNQMLNLCRAGLTSNEAYRKLQGDNPDGTRNPAYPDLLDVPQYIDYLIVNIWGGNWDWPWKNFYAGRDRTAAGTGFKFYCWDFENTMGNNLGRSPLNKNALNNDFSLAGEPHQYLRQNAEYRLLFADRVHRFLFNGGVLTPESLIPRYTDLATRVEMAIIGESARWGDQFFHPPLTLEDWYDRDQNYNDGRAGRDWILNYYLPQRTAIVLNQFRSAGLYPNVEAPVFYVNGVYQHGGHVRTSDDLWMTAGGIVFYTLDDSDPRIPEQTGSTTPGTLVAEDAFKRVLVPTGPVDDAWRGGRDFDDSAWTPVMGSPGGVGYERNAGYESLISLSVLQQMYNKQTSCCIRIPFVLDRELGESEILHLLVRYDDAFVAYLNGSEIARSQFTGEPAWDSMADEQNPDDAAAQLEDFPLPDARALLKQGLNYLAVQIMNESTTSSDLLLSVMLVANSQPAGGGDAPAIMEYTGPIKLSRSGVVKARAQVGGTWSALNEAVFAVGPVAENLRISEIMYHPAGDANTEYIELTNIGGESINLNLVTFTEGIDFVFPSFDLAPDSCCLVVKDITAFGTRYGRGLPVVGRYSGSLSNAGEQIELRDAVGTVILSFRYDDDWFDKTDGEGYSLTVRDPRTADPNAFGDEDLWRAGARVGGSPGTSDQ